MIVPDFIERNVQDARRLFGVGGPEWHIAIVMTDKPGGYEENMGFANINWAYLNATLEFSDTLVDDDTCRQVVFHEVLHIVHEQVDHFVIPIIPEEYKDLYKETIENFIQRLSRTIAYWSGK